MSSSFSVIASCRYSLCIFRAAAHVLCVDIHRAPWYSSVRNGYVVSEDYVGCRSPSCRRRRIHSLYAGDFLRLREIRHVLRITLKHNGGIHFFGRRSNRDRGRRKDSFQLMRIFHILVNNDTILENRWNSSTGHRLLQRVAMPLASTCRGRRAYLTPAASGGTFAAPRSPGEQSKKL